MAVIVHCVDETMFTSTLMIVFVYETMILVSDNTQNRHNRGEGK